MQEVYLCTLFFQTRIAADDTDIADRSDMDQTVELEISAEARRIRVTAGDSRGIAFLHADAPSTAG